MSPRKTITETVRNWIKRAEEDKSLSDDSLDRLQERIFAIELLAISLRWVKLEKELEAWREKRHEEYQAKMKVRSGE